AATRPHCHAKYTDHRHGAARDTHHPYRNRQRLRRELCTAGRKRHRFRYYVARNGWQMARAAQGGCPDDANVTLLFNPATATYFEYWLTPFKAAAGSFAVEAIAAPVHDRSELESVIAEQARAPNGGLVVMPDTFTDAHRVEITSLAARYRLP